MKAPTVAPALAAALLALPAFAATPREGTWEIQSFDADTSVDLRLQGPEVVMHRSMRKEFGGQPYTLEHLFRGRLGEGKLTFKMLARDDPKARFEELRTVEVEFATPESMVLDGARVLFVAPPAGAPTVVAPPAPVASPEPVPVPGRSWTQGLGYLSRIVGQAGSSEELFGMYRAIAVSKEGEASLAAGEAAARRQEWKQAVAGFEGALEAGLPLSRLAAGLARAYLETKDCARAEKMIGRVVRLDPMGQAAGALAASLKTACPATKVAVPVRLDRAAAAKIVAALEGREAAGRLANPRSFDDVSEILKLDQFPLFPAAIAFISTQKDVRAQALGAQIELAWAESLQQLAEIDLNLSTRFFDLADEAEEKAATKGMSGPEFQRLKELRAKAADAQQTAEALKLSAAEHLARGVEIARQVIKQAPTEYLGYRVAADYYRLTGDWKGFDGMLARLAKANPSSNGLVFLKGVAAYQRDRDVAAASKLLRTAVKNDPRFTRAQVHLMMIQPTLEETWAEFVKLQQMSPEHPVVRWTGPGLARLRE